MKIFGALSASVLILALAGALTCLIWAWPVMLAIGATDIAHPGYWQCIPAGFLIGAVATDSAGG